MKNVFFLFLFSIYSSASWFWLIIYIYIYIYILLLLLNAKLFAYDTSLFSVIYDSNTSSKISRWAFQWKTSFKPDPKKQAQGVIFSRKSKVISHSRLVFNNNVIHTTSKKHLGIILGARLSFEKHLETVLCKINKTVSLIRKL